MPHRLLMNRRDFADLRLDTLARPARAEQGEVVFGLSRFALTFNNITYASYGDRLRYWQFFPVDEQHGLLPVWGYADVVESGVAGVEAGQRFYGFWPLASHCMLQPSKVGAHSFRDEARHRVDLPEIYNWYQRTDDDAFHDATSEPLHAIYRPLFVTAFCLADFLADNASFGARRIIVSSASSKTAYATAFCLRQHKNGASGTKLVGLTSSRNREFVERLDLYDSVTVYDDLEQLESGTPTLYVDIAGNPALQARIHKHFGESLVHDASVGSAHSLEPPEPALKLAGPQPRFFFAPSWIAKRYVDWGTAGFNRRVGESMAAFFRRVVEDRLVEPLEHTGLDAARDVIIAMVRDRTEPRLGHVIRLDSAL